MTVTFEPSKRIAFYPQTLEAIKSRNNLGRIDGGIKRVGLNRGATRQLDYADCKAAQPRRVWRFVSDRSSCG